jgi:hypothetical protein
MPGSFSVAAQLAPTRVVLCSIEDRPDHHEDILTFLYMGPLFYGEFADFTILYLHSTDNMY